MFRKLLDWFKSGNSDKPDSLGDIIDVCVELLDEGSEGWRLTKALHIGNGYYKLLLPPKYDPEDELWAFLPGDIVRSEQVPSSFGLIKRAASHPNVNAIRIDVEQTERSPFWVRRSNALAMGDGPYKILPTPTYDPKDGHWKFLPGDIVWLKQFKASDGFTYLMPFEKIGDAEKNYRNHQER